MRSRALRHPSLAASSLALAFALVAAACGGAPADEDLPPAPLTVGGSVEGLTGTLVLQNDWGDDLTVTGDGPFAFATAAVPGQPYAVTVLRQPTGTSCRVTGGTGTVGAASVTGVTVRCAGMARVVYETSGGGVWELRSVFEDGTGDLSLVASAAEVHRSAVAPDGRVVFLQGSFTGDLFSVKADGTGLVPLAATAEAETFEGVDPEGRVVFSRGGDLFSVGADGSDPVALATSADVETLAGFGPLGRVFYHRAVGGGLFDLDVVGRDGQGRVPLAADARFAGVSPAGRVLYYRPFGPLWSVNLDGTGAVRISDHPRCGTTMSSTTPAYHSIVGYAPGGRVVFLQVHTEMHGGQAYACSTRDDVEATVPLNTLHIDRRTRVVGLTPGGRLVSVEEVNGDGNLTLCGIDADGTGSVVLERPLAPGSGDGVAAMLPDGRVVFPTAAGLVAVASDGTGRTPLSAAASDDYQGAVPGGEIVYRTAEGALFGVAPDGTSPRLVAPAPAVLQGVTPAGRLLFRHDTVQGAGPGDAPDTDLFSVFPDGSGTRTLADPPDPNDVMAVVPSRQDWSAPPVDPTARSIEAFAFKGASTATTIDQAARRIDVVVSHGTALGALAPTFHAEGVRVRVGDAPQASSLTPQDFTSPVPYLVTAADGRSTTYTVSVTVALDSSKAITAFSFAIPSYAMIDEGARTITVIVPGATNRDGLVATFTTTGASVKVGAVTQVSGVTPNDFRAPVSYVVTAEDGSTATWVVTVDLGP